MTAQDGRIACAQRTEQQISAIVRDELAQEAARLETEPHQMTAEDARVWFGLLVRDNIPPGGAR